MAIHMFQQLIDTLKKSPKKIVFTFCIYEFILYLLF